MPTADETITNIHVRYKESIKYLMIRSGATFWKYILMAGWFAFELVCCKIGLKASGYLESQLKIYDIYHSQLIEMGELSGFGEGWPAWLKILVISMLNGVVFISINTFVNGAGGAGTPLMKLVSQFILGNNPMISTDNEHGIPAPSDVNPLAGMNLGGLDLSKLGNLNLGSIFSSMASGFTNNMQSTAASASTAAGSGPAGPRGPRNRNRRQGPTHHQ